MTHAGFVLGSYALGVAIPAAFAIVSMRRLSSARRRLRAIDPRGGR